MSRDFEIETSEKIHEKCHISGKERERQNPRI